MRPPMRDSGDESFAIRGAMMILRMFAAWTALTVFSAFAHPALAAGAGGIDPEAIAAAVAAVRPLDYGQSGPEHRELERLINATHGSPELRAVIEERIAGALLSEETAMAAKQFFCELLSRMGGEVSLPALAGTLRKPDLYHVNMACYALKTNPSPKVNPLLREALDGRGQPMFPIPVIELLGERRDAEAAEKLNTLLGETLTGTKREDTSIVAGYLIAALGNIGTAECAAMLRARRGEAHRGYEDKLADALLQCAMRAKEDGEIERAVSILRDLAEDGEPPVIQKGARSNLLDLGRLEIDFESIEPERLFDGEGFEGWNGNLEYFRIEDGSIVGGRMDAPIPHNEFLCTNREFSHFELRLKFKILGADPNAGVQIRSVRVPNSHEMRGYQADMGQQYWGCLYDESRRNRVLAAPDHDELMKHVNRDGWNEYVIRCEGRRIQLWINGYQTVDYLEPDETIGQRGAIGLQIHSGPPSEAWYKDIVIQEYQ